MDLRSVHVAEPIYKKPPCRCRPLPLRAPLWRVVQEAEQQHLGVCQEASQRQNVSLHDRPRVLILMILATYLDI